MAPLPKLRESRWCRAVRGSSARRKHATVGRKLPRHERRVIRRRRRANGQVHAFLHEIDGSVLQPELDAEARMPRGEGRHD